MKKFVFIGFVLSIFVLLLMLNISQINDKSNGDSVDIGLQKVEALATNSSENLTCEDAGSECYGAECGEPGQISGCTLICNSGAWVFCEIEESNSIAYSVPQNCNKKLN